MGARIDDVCDGSGVHCFQQNKAAGGIVAVEAQRVAHRFANFDIAGEMHDGLRPVLGDDRIDAGAFS